MLPLSRRKIYVFSTSLILLSLSLPVLAQKTEEKKDSVDIPLSIRAGVDVLSPVIYLTNKDVLSTEAFFSADLNEKYGLFMGGGFSDYKYSQYNYDYLNKGFFIKTGVDFNLLKPEVSAGKYWGGIGLRYGISSFSYEIPAFSHENYWGIASSSVGKTSAWGHYLEISPGFRARIFANFSMGWSIHLRRLLYTGTGKDLRPIYFPGFGTGDKPTSTGISYYFSWNFTYRKIRVKIKEDAPPPESEQAGTVQQTGVSQPPVSR